MQRSSMGKLLSGRTYDIPWKANKPKYVPQPGWCRRKLTDEEVYSARLRASLGEPIYKLAIDYDINHSGMSKLVRGVLYKSAPGPITPAKPKETVGNAGAFTMRMDRARTNAPRKVLARKYGCSESTVSLILTGKRYPNAGGPILERLF